MKLYREKNDEFKFSDIYISDNLAALAEESDENKAIIDSFIKSFLAEDWGSLSRDETVANNDAKFFAGGRFMRGRYIAFDKKVVLDTMYDTTVIYFDSDELGENIQELRTAQQKKRRTY